MTGRAQSAPFSGFSGFGGFGGFGDDAPDASSAHNSHSNIDSGRQRPQQQRASNQQQQQQQQPLRRPAQQQSMHQSMQQQPMQQQRAAGAAGAAVPGGFLAAFLPAGAITEAQQQQSPDHLQQQNQKNHQQQSHQASQHTADTQDEGRESKASESQQILSNLAQESSPSLLAESRTTLQDHLADGKQGMATMGAGATSVAAEPSSDQVTLVNLDIAATRSSSNSSNGSHPTSAEASPSVHEQSSSGRKPISPLGTDSDMIALQVGLSDPDFLQRKSELEKASELKRILLQQAVRERETKARQESQVLTVVKEELNKLDNLLANDVSILREKIEGAERELTSAKRRYAAAEQEFVQAKLGLQKSLDAKELLTGHLYVIMQQNEDRKAKKLKELMEKLGITDAEIQQQQQQQQAKSCCWLLLFY
ncbi:hypothetical protein CAOG_05319 [Capsaspora owczarzaki ATCC 30864]|uniref:hypothetical protein n=1 Tax=Capsaspora owczarzaki (strain ATCC 30864) TaxID=595528 RepID=UPI0003521481|nr:hypothetical protein CAOG_05319 [Capsaspora owczarzaki ATCC 30864]|eukprot:XP_004347004.2 hypothetical protein CAOG_05319 [Capsaspora owczarzaki ATCC 30864]